MGYKSKILYKMVAEAGKDIAMSAYRCSKFLKDAVLTEVIPRELKPKLKNYKPPKGYLRAVRPIIKAYGGFLAGSASIVLSRDSNHLTALMQASPFYIYGLGDGCYDALDFRRSESSLPPATLAIELPYSYLSKIYRRARTKTTF